MFAKLTKMDASSRKIVLIVDNCPCHPQIENLRNTKLMFLLPNTTAFTQPMDRVLSAISNIIINWILSDVGLLQLIITKNFNLLQAIYFVDKSWKKVTEETIQNCFKHVRFIQSGEPFVFEEDTTSIIFRDSLSQQHYPNTDLAEYLETDYHLSTTDVVTEDSIVHDILGDNTLTDDKDDEIIDVIHEVKSTRESAAASLKTLRVFLESQDDSSKFLNFLYEIEDYITDVTFRKPTKQLSITSYTESDN